MCTQIHAQVISSNCISSCLNAIARFQKELSCALLKKKKKQTEIILFNLQSGYAERKQKQLS